MKKFSLFLVVALFNFVGLTSCLENGDNKSTGEYVGVLELGRNYTTPVLKTLAGSFYGPELNSFVNEGKMQLGNCYYFQISYDMGLPENSEQMVELNGYYTVSVTGYAEASKQYANSYLTDTSAVLPGELAVKQAIYSDAPFGYAENYLFITHYLSHEKDLDVNWDLSFDSENMMTEENGHRNYNVFIRATGADHDDSKTATEQLHFKAYQMGYFFESVARMEKERLGSSYTQTSTFTLKLNFASEIKDTGITWESQTVDNFYIAWFVPDGY
ncbi:MAG: hypothetical protein LBJ47_11375 [Tannerella sp.]|jgi:hypothetical protein|nr:hypothetical protein [Tannerella sp.]